MEQIWKAIITYWNISRYPQSIECLAAEVFSSCVYLVTSDSINEAPNAI